AVWCGPCQKMKHDVYPSEAVTPYHDKFIWAYLDADAAANKKPMKDFNVSGIPHIEFLDSTGKSIGKQVGSNDPAAFAAKLAEMLKLGGKS
ncbi:MAG: thioredoxin domain-containing protein, partial [Verrucomicrobiaceae bacterium]